MIFSPLQVDGCYRIDPEPRMDERGLFARTFCAEEFSAHGLALDWVQVNASVTTHAGTVRGLHFQRPPMSEAKLIRCIRGAVWDVMVDLRANSPSFGRWAAIELSGDNRAMVYIAPGCAHGFQALRDDSELLYFHSAPYSPAHEGGVHHADPVIGISWPLPVGALSPRDSALPPLADVVPIQ